MFSTSFTRIAHRVLALVACTGAILALTVGPVQAGHGGGTTIESAKWDGTEIDARGKGERTSSGAGPVMLFDADTNTQIGTDPDIGNSHKWKILTPICAFNVYAIQDGLQSSTRTDAPCATCVS